MQKPNIDDNLTLLTDVGKTEAIVVDVLDNPATEEGVLLKVMTRGSFEQGQQVWILDRDGSKIGATVENVVRANNRQRSDTLDSVAGIAVGASWTAELPESAASQLQVDALQLNRAQAEPPSVPLHPQACFRCAFLL